MLYAVTLSHYWRTKATFVPILTHFGQDAGLQHCANMVYAMSLHLSSFRPQFLKGVGDTPDVFSVTQPMISHH